MLEVYHRAIMIGLSEAEATRAADDAYDQYQYEESQRGTELDAEAQHYAELEAQHIAELEEQAKKAEEVENG